MDIDPPRRRLHRAEFRRVDPRDRRKLVRIVRDFAPTAVVHLGVYEPNARAGPALARSLTHEFTVSALGAAAQSPDLDRVVVRSGHRDLRSSTRGCHEAGRVGSALADDTLRAVAARSRTGRLVTRPAAAGAALSLVRCAPIVGPHMSSPLGRLLRLPVVPTGGLSDLPFSLLHQNDAAHVPSSSRSRPVTTAPSTSSVLVRSPARRPPGSAAVCRFRWSALNGSPLAPWLNWSARRCRRTCGSCSLEDGRPTAGLAVDVLGLRDLRTTPEVVRDLYDWATVTFLREAEAA